MKQMKMAKDKCTIKEKGMKDLFKHQEVLADSNILYFSWNQFQFYQNKVIIHLSN
jgi:hypothetical protein